MPEQSMNIDKIMNRIKSTLELAKKNRKTLSKYDVPMSQSYELNYVKLSSEIDQNNRGWNVSPEYVLTSHRPVLGKLIVFGKKIIRKLLRWYINPAFEKQSNFNGSVTRSFNNINPILSDLIKDIEFLKGKNSKIDDLETELTKVINNSISDQNNDQISNFFIDLEQVLNKQNKLEEDFKSIENIISSQKLIEQKLQEVEDKLASIEEVLVKQQNIADGITEINNRVNQISSGYLHNDTFIEFKNKIYNDVRIINEKIEKTDDLILLINSRIKKNTTKIVKKDSPEAINETKEVNNVKQLENNLELDYFLFEQKFRGSRSVIMERQRDYLPLFANRKEVLDIGCGRGEFIELLHKEYGVNVKGIDINNDMIDYCKERGFNVELIDAIDYLEKLNDNSLDGIFMAQVIEHLTSEQAMSLINSVYRVLKPGGLFVVETINVQSVFAMSNWFYMDPTHIKPVHPVTLKFIFQGSGYSQVDIKYLSPVPDKGVPHLQIDGVDLSHFNESLNDLNGLIYGYQDYAICAYK
ncbi:methyltransferase domain-containing protein [Paenibacillus sp. 32352]|uniref:methyltransferase domain-containing protein n=1 Tax=Paenibacillus sp. 32352 TaxID=1969111 RepID=UPI0009AE7280|nr:methyltransferase domain-containing protein [Paenibacillus sp. 32352]